MPYSSTTTSLTIQSSKSNGFERSSYISSYPGNRPRLSITTSSYIHPGNNTLQNGSQSPSSNHSSESSSSVTLATSALVNLVNTSRNSKPLWQRDVNSSSDSSDDDSFDLPSPAYSPEESSNVSHAPLLKKKTTSNRKKAEGYTARPANAFILYRSEQIRLFKMSGTAKKPQSEVSKLIGQMWRDESKVNKDSWMERAAQEKARHIEKFPDYRFSPVRRNSDSKVKTTRGPYAPKLSKIRRASTNSASTLSDSRPGTPIPFRRASTSLAPRIGGTTSGFAPPFIPTRTFTIKSPAPTPFFRAVDIVATRPRPVPIIPVAYISNNSQYLPSPLMDHPSPPHSATTIKQEWPSYHSTLHSASSPPPVLPPSPPYTSASDVRTFARVVPLQQYEDVQNHIEGNSQQAFVYNPNVRLSSAVLPPSPLYDSRYRLHQVPEYQEHQQSHLHDHHSQQLQDSSHQMHLAQQPPQEQQQYWQPHPSSDTYVPPPRQSPQFLQPSNSYESHSSSSSGGNASEYYTYLSQPPDAQHHVLPYSAQDSPYGGSQFSPYPFALSPRPPTSVTSAPGDYFSLPA